MAYKAFVIKLLCAILDYLILPKGTVGRDRKHQMLISDATIWAENYIDVVIE